MRVSLPWARGEANGDRREQCGEKNVRYFGTEVGREGVASQPVWPVRSGGTLGAHAWLCSFYLTKSDELTTRAASAIRHHWTAWVNTFYVVAERVSPVRLFSTREIKGLRVAEVSRIRAACTLALSVLAPTRTIPPFNVPYCRMLAVRRSARTPAWQARRCRAHPAWAASPAVRA